MPRGFPRSWGEGAAVRGIEAVGTVVRAGFQKLKASCRAGPALPVLPSWSLSVLICEHGLDRPSYSPEGGGGWGSEQLVCCMA